MGEFYAMEYDAWDEGTVSLTLEEEAAFLRICHQIYRRQQPIPNSNKLLCTLWRCHPNKAKALLQRLISEGKITINEDGRLTNDRTAKEIHVRETLRTRRAHAGHTGGIRSGEARRKSLENNDTDEAKRSTGQDKTVHNRTEEKKDGADAPPAQLFELPVDLKKQFWDRAKEILGTTEASRGLIGRLAKAKGEDWALARAALEVASTKVNPRSYIAGVCNQSNGATRTGHEYQII